LGDAPLTSLAHEKSLLSGSQVDVLLAARFAAPEAYDEAENHLVGMAISTPLVRDLHKQVDYWLERVDPDELAWTRHNVREMRALTLRRDGEMVRINGWVDIESGERLLAGLEPGPPVQGDDRSTPARRADLLLEILDGASDRPGLTVLVSAETLVNRASGISETINGSFLTVDEIQRLACDANVTRVIFDPESRPLDVGRTKRLVTPAMRIALSARDLRCLFPGCDRPSRWCDAHHIVHWINGGTTSVDNLVLLCRHHHVLVHEAGWEITGTAGDLHFHRDDGTELGADPPPVLMRSPYSTIRPKRRPPGDLIAAIRALHGLPSP
jgi:hypothetical protein